MPHHKQEGDDGQEDDSEEDALTRLMSLIITSTCKWQTCVRALKQVATAFSKATQKIPKRHPNAPL